VSPVLTPAPPHPVPAGPLAVRWLGYDVPAVRAGTAAGARVELENAGSATWRSRGEQGVQLAYHWLDPLRNPILWDGVRTRLSHAVGPGERIELAADLRAPLQPGDYLLAFDLVHEHRFWFAEVGSAPLELPVTVLPRLERRGLAVVVGDGPAGLVAATAAALAAQEEPVAATGAATAYLAAGCRPAPDWSGRILDAHEEGFAAVGGSVELRGGIVERRPFRDLRPWEPGFGRSPDWPRALLCPSVLGLVELGELHGLPALEPRAAGGPALCDGRIRVAVEARALRRARRPAG
jgi:hypothetical protein